MKLRVEHLPADVLGLSSVARLGLSEGAVNGIPVARRASDVTRLEDRHPIAEREELARAIQQGLSPLDPPGRVRTSLEVLSREGSFCVITGQQPGLLTGPLYTLYKAMQACKLSAELSAEWGTPVVPMFWNHADDHDVAEVHHAWLFNRNLDLQKAGIAGMSSGRTPIGRLVLDEDTHRLGATRALLTQAHEEFDHVEEAVALLAPRAGETLARACTRALTALLGEHGLVVVEPDWIRPQLSRALSRIVERDPREALLAARALEPGPAIDPESAALVYRVDEDGRHALRLGGEGYVDEDQPGSRTPAELAAEVLQDPHDWSAGALVRPLVQDLALPVVAYVGGWGELGYHAQLGAARDVANVPRTAFVPRVSITQVTPELAVSLGKLEVDLRTALAARGKPEVEGASPPEPPVFAAIRQVAADTRAALFEQREALAALEPSLAAGLKRAADQNETNLEKLLGKAKRVHDNQAGKGRRHVRRVQHALFPRDTPQERLLTPLGFLARWGLPYVDALYSEVPAVSSEHVVLFLEED